MASTATVQAASVPPISASTPKKAKSQTTKSAVSAPAHPSTAVMVIAAIKELNEKKGSSLSAIKKCMSTNYKVDSVRLAPFIRKFLKSAVVKGVLQQTNGTGAMGHFRLPVEVKKKPAVVKQISAKASSAGSPKKRKVTAKKVPTASEPVAKKPKTITAKPKKSLVKTKKAVVAPKPPKAKKAATAVKKTKTAKKN